MTIPSRAVPDAPQLEACIHGKAYSSQSDNRVALESWKRQVSGVSAAAWRDRPPLTGAVELHIFHYTELLAADLDNLNKPIQDALQGVVFFGRPAGAIIAKRLAGY